MESLNVDTNFYGLSKICDRFIRLPEVCHLTGHSRSKIYDLIKRKLFPLPLKPYGSRISVWRLSDIIEYMSNCTTGGKYEYHS